MFFSSSRRHADGSAGRKRSGRSQSARQRPTITRLEIEPLEDRTLLSNFGLGYAFNVGPQTTSLGPNTVSYGIAADGQGNVYVSGAFNGSKVNFDPLNPTPAPSAYLTSQAGTSGEDAFIAKYSPAGLLQWATDLGNDTASDYVGVAISGSGSSVYATGNLAGKNTALAQLDASNGNIVSSVTTQALGGYGLGIAVDPSTGNVYVTGSTAASQAFVAKFDPSLNPLWTKTTTTTSGGTTDATPSVYCGARIAVDGSGNAYVTGGYTGTVTFGSTTLTSWGGTEDVFAWKLDANGNSTWAGSMGSNGNDLGTGIAVDGSGNLYVTGNWGQGSTTASKNNNFNPGPGGAIQLTHQSNGGHAAEGVDIFVVKLVPTAGASYTAESPGWAKDIGGTYNTDSRALALDAAGNIYITGSYTGTVQFGPYTLQSYGAKKGSSGQTNIYVAELNSSGTVVAAVSATGTTSNPSFGEAITVDGSGNIYSTGWLRGTANFNPNGTYDLTANDPSSNVYVWKLTQPSASAATSNMLLTPTAVSSTSKSQDMAVPSSISAPLRGLTPPAQSGTSLSAADQVFADFALLLSDSWNVYQSGLSSLAAMWQSADALASQRLDALLSMEAGAMGVSKDTLMRDLLSTSMSTPKGM